MSVHRGACVGVCVCVLVCVSVVVGETAKRKRWHDDLNFGGYTLR